MRLFPIPPMRSPSAETGPSFIAVIGWPVALGSVAFVTGLLMMAGAAYFNHQTRLLSEEATRAATQQSARSASEPASADSGLATQLPPASTHLNDVGWIFKLAKEQGVAVGGVTYRTETMASIPVTVRSMEMRVDEEYPKLKAFVAELLRDLPHLYLNELRIEQGNAATGKVQATLNISMAYRDSPPARRSPIAEPGKQVMP
jgi:hypothetical protein